MFGRATIRLGIGPHSSSSLFTKYMGCVLGPICINDLDYGIKNYILKFADDPRIFGSILNRSDFCQLQDGINSLV